MRILRAIIFPLLAAGSLTVPGAGQAWAEDSHPGGLPETCPEVMSGSPSGDLEKLTDPSEGSDVHGGDVITVTLRWNPQSFDGPLLHKAVDCVTVNGEIAADLSGQERDAPNDGLFEWRYTVPADVPVGARICDRGFVSGPAPGGNFEREKSNDVCFTVAPPLTATAPNGPAPSGSAPSGSAPNGSAPSGSAPSGSAPSGSPPTNSGPTSPAPSPTPSSATPPAPRTPEASSPTAGPRPTGGGTPGADASSPPVAVLASPPLTPLSPEVKFDTALPTTGATPTPLVLAGMTVCAGGACIMAGARRRRRSPSHRPVT